MNSCYILISQVNIVKTCSKLESYTLRLEISKKKTFKKRKHEIRTQQEKSTPKSNLQICKKKELKS